MTEEKMAEEYSKSVCAWIEDREPLDERDIQEAFLAGLKAGRLTKWHSVANRDLPKEECGWVCNQDGLPCYFDWGTEQWLDCEGTQIRTTEWSDIPHKE